MGKKATHTNKGVMVTQKVRNAQECRRQSQ